MPEDDHITNALLGITEDHYAQPEVGDTFSRLSVSKVDAGVLFQGHFGLSTIEELELAIQNCKQLILQTPPRTDRMKNLVGKLVQLRLRYTEAKVSCLWKYRTSFPWRNNIRFVLALGNLEKGLIFFLALKISSPAECLKSCHTNLWFIILEFLWK